MNKIVSEDALRRALERIDEPKLTMPSTNSSHLLFSRLVRLNGLGQVFVLFAGFITANAF